jgi:hypothetical protein
MDRELEPKRVAPDCTCGAATTKNVCERPFYDAFDVCLICSHGRTCHLEQQVT